MFMCFIEKKNRIPLWGDLLLLILGFFFGALIAEECTLSVQWCLWLSCFCIVS